MAIWNVENATKYSSIKAFSLFCPFVFVPIFGDGGGDKLYKVGGENTAKHCDWVKLWLKSELSIIFSVISCALVNKSPWHLWIIGVCEKFTKQSASSMLPLEETNKRKDKIGNSQYTIAMFAKCQLVSLLEFCFYFFV